MAFISIFTKESVHIKKRLRLTQFLLQIGHAAACTCSAACRRHSSIAQAALPLTSLLILAHDKKSSMTSSSFLFKALCLYLTIPTVTSLIAYTPSKVKVGRVSAGPIDISSLGCGTWSWGNKLLWDYDPSQDEEIYRAYRAVRDAGVTIFDTADSYGTLELNGRAEILLGQFERRYQEETSNNKSQSSMMFDIGSLLGGPASNKNNKQQVATKFAPYPWRITRGSLVQAAKESLKRLDQDSKCSSYGSIDTFH